MYCTWQLGSCRWWKPASTTGCCSVVIPFKGLVLAQQAPLQLANIGALLGQGRLLLLQLLCLHACMTFVFFALADRCCTLNHLRRDRTQHCSSSSKASATQLLPCMQRWKQ